MSMQDPPEPSFNMPGLTYVPVENGTIRIGSTREVNGREIPVSTDHFRVTRLVHRDDDWLDHPVTKPLLEQQAKRNLEAAGDDEALAGKPVKLRQIPIRFQFNDPGLIAQTRFEAFDTRAKRPVCASSSAGKAIRIQADGKPATVDCVGPEACAFASSEGIRCKFFGRVSVQIQAEKDPDATFMLRTTSVNTMRNLETKLRRYRAMFGGRLTGIPFLLSMRSRTTAGSAWSRFYFLDLGLDGVTHAEAAAGARKHAKDLEDAGLCMEAFEACARAGLENGRLSHNPTEGALMAEFFMEAGSDDSLGAEKLVPTTGAPSDAAKATAPSSKVAAVVISGLRLSMDSAHQSEHLYVDEVGR